MTTLTQVTDDTFEEEVKRQSRPVLVFCTADWAPPCRKMMPIIAEFAEKYPDIKVVTLDYDANPNTIRALDVEGVPDVVLFQDNSVRGHIPGSIRSISKIEGNLRLLSNY